ncbi:hypothetical protein VF08_37745, partial [Nostoc linckia z8]
GLRGDRLDVLRGHALADDALHAGESRADLVLDELAHRADATVAEVVDVVDVETDLDVLATAHTLEGLVAAVHAHEVLDGGDDVVDGQHRVRQRSIQPQLLVDLVATDLRQVVPLGVEVEVVQQRAGGLGGDLLARTELAVDVAERVLLGQDRVLGEGLLDGVEAAELVQDVFARQAEGLEEHRDRLLALAVDADAHLVALVDLELQPRTAAGDDARRHDVLVGGLVGGLVEVDAGRAHELRDHDTLGAVDDERALVGLEREVAHEDRLGLDLTGLVVHELGLDVERGRVGLAALLALFDRVLLGLEVGVGERELHGLAQVLDRRDLLEDLLQSAHLGHIGATGGLGLGHPGPPLLVADEPVEGLGLQREKVGNRQRVGDLREREPRCAAAVLRGGGGIGCVGRSSQGITSVSPDRASFPCRQVECSVLPEACTSLTAVKRGRAVTADHHMRAGGNQERNYQA